MAERHKVAQVSEVPAGSARCVDVAGREIALFHTADGFQAIDHVCPHAGGPLAEGELGEGGVTCPWHAWTFDLQTGASNRNPLVKVETYPVSVENDEVWLEL
jgi:nitrite reductase (NADH) small subunit